MITKQLDRRILIDAVEMAAHAPSVHNSQPWRFRAGPSGVELYADPGRWLPTTDADGRDILVSCGAALHHLRVALAEAGVGVTVRRLPDPDESLHLATLHFDGDVASDASVSELYSGILRRRTDRRPFTHWPVPDSFIRQLAEEATTQGAVLRAVRDAGATQVLLKAIAEAEAVQDSLPGYRQELENWSGREGTDGIPRSNLLRTGARVAAARHFSEGEIETTDDNQPEGSVLMVLGTASDDPLSRIRAGEALSAVLLKATHLGLASCPLSQPLEVATTREVLQNRVLDGTLAPQIVLRVGWGPAGSVLAATPRRPVSDIIDSLDD